MTERAATTSTGGSDEADLSSREATLWDWVERWAAHRPDSAAILTETGPVAYGALHQRAQSLAAFLRELGVGRGDVVAAQLPNSLEFVLTDLAAGYLGATLQPIHMPYRSAEIRSLVAHGGARVAVCSTRLKDFAAAEFLLSLRATVPTLREVVAVGSDPPPGAHRFPEHGALPQAARGERPHAQDRFLLLYTSGTTSAPKGVPVAYRKFLPNAARSAEELGIDETSVLLSAAPFTHLYGLFSLHLALAAGAATALLPAYSPADFARALDRDRPTGLFVAPAHMAACLAEGLLTRERLAAVRFVLISGSACPPDLAQAVQERMPNGEVLQLWGMSELQAGSFTRPGDEPRVRFGTAGRASPGTELRVALDGAPAPPGVEGELQVRGPSVFDGYLDNAQATADAFTPEGWFRTGDLARMDEHGNIQITGRSKDVINRGGVKFNAADVEALLARHPGVASCAIVPTPDPVLGERACCFVVLKPQADGLRLEDLCRWLADHGVAKVKWPERLEIVDEMPMTPTRKIMKGELARRVAAQT